jgi:aldehyde dehydrogenase (NAD+)
MSQPLPHELFDQQKLYHPIVKQTSAKERIRKLQLLREAILTRSEALKNAMHKDFNKAGPEVDLSEIFPVISEIDFNIKYLRKWMKPRNVSTPIALFGTHSQILFEPKGNVLIIGPWNYPFQLILAPLISAIAAGNCAILKPSELAPHTSHFIQALVADLFEEREIACVEGDALISQTLLKLPFDHIFFTGSTRLGKIVMEAAAKNLSSVTLELGGKSPVIIDESADLVKAARSIAWGKFLNAGQTCVAPDYVFIHDQQVTVFSQALKTAIEKLYGNTESDREKSTDLCRIINPSHFTRIQSLTQKTLEQGAQLEIGGLYNEQSRYIAPTVLTRVLTNSPIMQEEIFGPILPILSYTSLDEVYNLLRTDPALKKPLALYIFSRSQQRTEEILKNTTAGGTSVNTTLLHLLNPHLPFGGVGGSGQWSYHGYFGFKAFSHERAVMRQGIFDALKFLQPPYVPFVRKLIRIAIRFLT